MSFLIFIACYGVAMNFTMAACVVYLLRRARSATGWLQGCVILWAVAMSVLFVIQVFDPAVLKPFLRDWFYVPMGIEMSWNVLLAQIFCPIIILITLVVRRWPKRRAEPPPLTPAGISRRRFLCLAGAGAVPAAALAMGVHGGLSRYDLQVRRFDLPITHLPPDLEGFTIAHVSDLHSGLFVGPRRLQQVADATNDLKADLIALTGDLINRDMNELPDALAAIRRMESRLGLYICEGNHDVIPGPGRVVTACAQNGFPVLFNSWTGLHVGVGRLVLGGLSWERYIDRDLYPSMVADLFPPRQADDVRILLAHHPHLFDIAQDADVVLSGHTHGGQIMFGDNAGLGRIRFKYCSGLFRRGNTTLIVSNGAGDWFPCRIGAPAEIGLLRLTRAVG